MALTGEGAAKFAKTMLGTPYIYGAKNQIVTQSMVNSWTRMYPSVFTPAYLKKIKTKKLVGKRCCDCSGLLYAYSGKLYGTAQMYSIATKRMSIKDWKKFPIGTSVWKEGHTGIYIGNGYVIECKGIDYGCVKTKISDTAWTHGLLMPYIEYGEAADDVIYKVKGSNPYTKAKPNLKKGSKGVTVKWLQWELVESGYPLDIDGSFGISTYNALVKFQKSCKIKADGIVGKDTIAKLVADGPSAPKKKEDEKKVEPKKDDTPTGTYKIGSKGSDVKWIQKKLAKAGYDIKADGVYGEKTAEAIEKFQKKHNLTVDGVAGKKTITKLATIK